MAQGGTSSSYRTRERHSQDRITVVELNCSEEQEEDRPYALRLLLVAPNDIYKRVGLRRLDGRETVFLEPASRSHVTSLC